MASRGGPIGNPNPASAPGARYAYLVGRLRNRQITMEEATELFALMDETIRMLRTATLRLPPPPPSARSTPTPPPPVSSGGKAGIGADDLLTAGVLMIGAGAGISAALRRRAIDGPKRADSASPATEQRSSSGP
jgi:hypothetical protein